MRNIYILIDQIPFLFELHNIAFQHARSKFRSMLSESTQHLNTLCKKLGKSINKARPYYELLKQARVVSGYYCKPPV